MVCVNRTTHGTSCKNRWIAALWFGGAGFVVAGLMFLIPSMEQGLVETMLYVLAPSVAAFLAGGLFGNTILDPAKTTNYWVATIRGLAVILIAFVLYALSYAVSYPLLTPEGSSSFVGLLFAVLSVGLLSSAPLLVGVGIPAALLLYTIACQRMKK
ncbi:MAG: hypothetical protein L0Y67_01350 [Gammaproteobacteria bacterium]|nr:hypothetical protein [Gammaproteobacteria bacterium]MCI0590248.1 hypothetical protein [Gammaproteobacteria bacterium]